MNILIFSWRGPSHPNSGGAEISTHEHAKGWIKAGYNVVLFTSYYKSAKKEEKIDGVRIIRQGGSIFGVQIKAAFWYLFGNHPKFDLVIDQFHGIPFFTPLYVKTPKLAFIHEVAKEVWKLNQLPFPLNKLVAAIGTIFEPFIFKLYKNIPFMTVSESTKKDLILFGIPKNNVTVIYNGVNVPKIVMPKKERKKTVVFLGVLEKDKGIDDALSVFNLLQREVANIQLWVIGKSDSKYQIFLNERVRKLGLKNIKFWGYVEESKKFELLAKAHLLINTSIREGWGLVVIEAASVGTPTVAFDVPGLRDSIKNKVTGLLSEGRDINKLAEIISNTLVDDDILAKLSKNAYEWSKNFNWTKSVSASLRLIEKIAG